MPRRDPTTTKVLAIAGPVCAAAGYEVVDVRLVTEPGGWVLRVYIDRPAPIGADGAVVPVDPSLPSADAVDLNDCERISRELGTVLDVEDPVPQAYSLEVSSPGIDRPLRTAGHFRRYLGADVKILLGVRHSGSQGDRRNFRGRLIAVEPATGAADDDRAFAVVDVDGTTYRLAIGDIETARIVPNWDVVLHPNSVTPPGYKPGQKIGKGKLAKAARAAEKAAATAAAAAAATAAGATPEAAAAAGVAAGDAHDDDHDGDDLDGDADDLDDHDGEVDDDAGDDDDSATPDPTTGSTTAQ